jgi:predicted acylesterase/phospholipase RssA
LRELADVSDDGEGRSIGEALGRHAQKQPYKGLLEEHDKYVAYLSADMGLFSGKAARDEFDALIRKAIRTKYPDMPADELDRRPAITFKDLKDLDFKLDLVLTGSNLATGRTELFSSRHTPAFPVADAVRISMSLPFVYKPYVITASPEGFPPCGTYVDGGLWNNLPYRDASVSGPRSTLSLRLEIVPPVRVQTIGDLLSRVATFGLFGTGESQVLRAYEVNMITLDTRGLDLIDFSPPVEPREQAIKRAARTVYLAFGQIPPVQYRDLRDDMASAQLRGASNVCGPGRLADVVP